MVQNRTVLVTGSGKGIGAACVKTFVERGARAVINYRSSEKEARQLHDELEGDTLLIQGDMSEEQDIVNLFDTVEEEWGTVDTLVNNAGIVGRTKFPELDGEDFREMLNVNTVGPYLVTRAFARRLGDREGAVVNIGSMRAFVPTSVDYSASKAALQNMTVALAKAMGPQVRVNAVAPGFTNTDMHEGNRERLDREAEKSVLKKYSEPEEIAAAVRFLASDDASSITGRVLLADNGRSLTS